MLVHYCATNFAEMTIINGSERGGPLNSIQDVPLKLMQGNYSNKTNPVFLDNLTGDYYTFDEKT